MKCPFCSSPDSVVKDSRSFEEGDAVKRRRQCLKCDGRFVTLEHVHFREISVKKKNGELRPFDRDKIIKSLTLAARKRPVSQELINSITTNIMKRIAKSGEYEVDTQLIGSMLMEELAKIDHVSYVRYASVYRDFSKTEDFANFIRDIV